MIQTKIMSLIILATIPENEEKVMSPFYKINVNICFQLYHKSLDHQLWCYIKRKVENRSFLLSPFMPLFPNQNQ